MIDDFNRRQRLLYGNLAANQVIVNVSNSPTPELPKIAKKPNETNKDSLVPLLLKIAQENNGQITVTQGVMATGKSFKEVETALLTIHKAGYATMDNHPVNGAIIYRIDQLIS